MRDAFLENRTRWLLAEGKQEQLDESDVLIESCEIVDQSGNHLKLSSGCPSTMFYRFVIQRLATLADKPKPSYLNWTQAREAFIALMFADLWDARDAVNDGKGIRELQAFANAREIANIKWKPSPE